MRFWAVSWAIWAIWAILPNGVWAAGEELRVLRPDARAVFYVGIAAPPSAVAAVRAFNRSLAEISQSFLAGDYPAYLRNITLQPLYIELPEDERFVDFSFIATHTSLLLLYQIHQYSVHFLPALSISKSTGGKHLDVSFSLTHVSI